MATFRKRPNGHWEAQVRRRGFPDLTRTFLLKADAVAWASQQELAVYRGEVIDRSLAEKTTLGELFLRYMEQISPSKKSGENEAVRLLALRRDPLAKFKMTALSGPVVAEWRDRRLRSVSGSTVNRDLNLISHVINTARREWGVAIDNPVALVRRPKENKGRIRRLSADEERRLLDALEVSERDLQGRITGPSNPWIRPIVLFAIETAMRRSEILAMLWENVFLGDADRYVRLADSKNGDSRCVPLSRRAIAILSALPKTHTGPVFPISADAVKKAFFRGVERAGIVDLHFHDLRHEATTRISKKLSNVLELSAVTGHKTLRMLQRYYHPDPVDLARRLD